MGGHQPPASCWYLLLKLTRRHASLYCCRRASIVSAQRMIHLALVLALRWSFPMSEDRRSPRRRHGHHGSRYVSVSCTSRWIETAAGVLVIICPSSPSPWSSSTFVFGDDRPTIPCRRWHWYCCAGFFQQNPIAWPLSSFCVTWGENLESSITPSWTSVPSFHVTCV